MAAVTLADMAAQEKEPLRKMIMAELLRQSDLIGVVPFENASSFDSILTRWHSLPTVGWRNLNEGYETSKGTTEQVTETIYFIGGDIEIDRQMKKVTNLLEPVESTQRKMKMAAMAYAYNNTFINGSHLVDPKQFPGIAVRLAGLPARQTIYASDLATSTVLPVLANQVNADRFLDQLWRLESLVEGKPTHYFMNSRTLWGLKSTLRRSGWLDTTKDSFDREFTTFGGALLVDVGLSGFLTPATTEAALEVISNVEVAGDGGLDSTSIYAVNMEIGRGCHGIKLGDMDIYDPLVGGERESGPQTLLRVDWGVGLANWSNYSIARLWNFGMVYA